MIDLHTHVLAGIDDGPATVPGSLDLARAAAAAGVTTLAATPHITWELPNTAASVATQVAGLQAELDAEEIGLRLVTGGEIAAVRALDLDDEELRGLALGGGGWLLVECPLSVAVVGLDRVLHELQERGHRIVLAHPERSPVLQRDPSLLEGFVEAGMLASITAGSVLGQFGSPVRRFTLDLIERGLVHNLASDAHDVARRPPAMDRAIAALEDELPGIADLVTWWTVDVPEAVLEGAEPPPAPAAAPRRTRRRRFRRAGRSR